MNILRRNQTFLCASTQQGIFPRDVSVMWSGRPLKTNTSKTVQWSIQGTSHSCLSSETKQQLTRLEQVPSRPERRRKCRVASHVISAATAFTGGREIIAGDKLQTKNQIKILTGCNPKETDHGLISFQSESPGRRRQWVQCSAVERSDSSWKQQRPAASPVLLISKHWLRALVLNEPCCRPAVALWAAPTWKIW